MTAFFRDCRLHDGLTYEAYLAGWKEAAEAPIPPTASPDERRRRHYLRYNYERSQRVHDAYVPSSDVQEAVGNLRSAQLWMVLTEPWCGDSAFSLPVLVEAARRAPAVDLRILLRDDNLDVMDQYLTRGTSRSIPRLVVFGMDGTERFRWGPRPAGAQALYDRLSQEGMPKRQVVGRVVEWYEAGGWEDVDAELAVAVVAS